MPDSQTEMGAGLIDSAEGRVLSQSQSLGLSGSWMDVLLTQEAPGPPSLSALSGAACSQLPCGRVVLGIQCINEWEALDCGGQSGNCGCY